MMASLLLIGTLAGQPAMNADVHLIISNVSYRTHTKRLELPAGTYKACAKLKDRKARCRTVLVQAGTDSTVAIPLDAKD
jgi:hypothetical protein